MSTIILLRPWLTSSKAEKQHGQNQEHKEQEHGEKEQGGKQSVDNVLIYIAPSMLDVLGTIVDTAGLYYVDLA